MRYREEVLKPLFIPFVTHLKVDFPHIQFIAQEDNASAHASKWCKEVWEATGITRLEWPANSPNLSAIEPPWGILKRKIDKKKVYNGNQGMTEQWTERWGDFPLDRF